MAYLIRRRLHEPELFVRDSRTRVPQSSFRLLVKDAATIKLSFGMAVLCSVQNFGYYGVMIWLPNYLSNRFGLALTQTAEWTVATIVGMSLGLVVFGQIADRIGRRTAFFIYMAGAAVMVLCYSRLSDPTELFYAGIAMGFFVNGMIGGYGALMSELYPTAARATAQNVLFNLGRAVGGFGPLLVGLMASTRGFEFAITVLAVLYLVDLAAMLLLIPERRGVELQ
jgi:MFS family permease